MKVRGNTNVQVTLISDGLPFSLCYKDRVKILIIGSGIMGKYLSSHFERLQWGVTNVNFPDFDLTKQSDVSSAIQKHRPDVIINAAAYTAVDLCEKESEIAFKINATAAGELAVECEKQNVRLVHISTDYVFNGEKKSPYIEEDPRSPISAYGKTKAEGEKLVIQASSHALIIRVAWSFRAGGTNFLCKLRELIFDRENLDIIHDHVGNCTYMPDFAFALESLIKKSTQGIVHFTNEGELSMYDFAVKLCETARSLGMNPKCKEIKPVSASQLKLAAERPHYSALDKTKYRKLTGNSIRHWHETLPDFLQEKASE
jgi:dTDP-4-dehydrorhamnose reductase